LRLLALLPKVYYLRFRSAIGQGWARRPRGGAMTEDFTLVPGESQKAVCPDCGYGYDAVSVEFCDCVTPTSSPVCPNCGNCLCKLSTDHQKAFWEAAPPALYRRKMASRKAGPEEGVQPPTGELKRPLILLAEDEAVTRRVAHRVLEKLGYGVLEAARGDEAYRLALEVLPDAVLTDALMPKMDGRELCLKLKQSPQTASIKVVIMTGLFTKSQSRTEAFQNFKADAFLKKPVDYEELREVLEKLLAPQ
jgi:CheY-like chemotaxis protein